MSEAAGGAVWPGSGGQGLVVVRSDLTDVRGLRNWLGQRGMAFDDVVLHMADAGQRHQFHELCEQTGWRTLPQIFLDGQFIGGESELRGQLEYGNLATRSPVKAVASPTRTMRLLSALGYLSALPFVLAFLALLALAGAQAAMVEYLLVAYGAVILSFLGAVHWGRILDAEPQDQVPVMAGLLAVMPALVGWGSLLLPTAWALPVQVALFIGIYAVDRVVLASLVLGAWYVRLRNRLTAVVVVVLLAAWLVVVI